MNAKAWSSMFTIWRLDIRLQVAPGEMFTSLAILVKEKTSFKFNRQEIAQAVAQLENKRCTSSAEVSDIT